MSIFDICPPANDGEKLNFFNFTTIGDAIEGTVVERKKNIVGKFGMQDSFGIKISTGEIFYVSVKHASKGFFEQMDKLVLGQIIGLKYTKDLPTNYGNPYKFIHLAQDPTIVDVTWLAEREAKKANLMAELNNGVTVAPTLSIPTLDQASGVVIPSGDLFPATPLEIPVMAPVTPVQPVVPVQPVTPVQPATIVMNDQQKVMKVAQVIRDRFGITVGDEIKVKVTELTHLPMITENLDAILLALG